MFSAVTQNPDFPSLMVADKSPAECSPLLMTYVGQSARRLSDEELEYHISSCTYLMERAWADYEAHGNFADRGTADRWRILRDEAVRSRSPAQVLALEIKRGLI